MKTCLLLSQPVPFWHIELEDRFNERHHLFKEVELFASLERETPVDLLRCCFRGVSIDRLSTVLRTGIDVEPTDSIIFADCFGFGKAWEYGGWPKLILALNPRGLERTYREVAADLPVDQLAELRKRYPSVLKSSDGSRLWLSRFPENSPRIATGYETEYARWIPGDALKVLKALLGFGPRAPELLHG